MQALRLILLGIRNNRKSVLKFLIPVLILEVLSVFFLYKLNGVYGTLYQSIQDYKPKLIWNSIGLFTTLAMVLVFIEGYLGFYINRLAFEIRTGLTSAVLSLSEKFSDVPLFGQRVQEDLNKFSTTVCDLFIAVLKSGLKLPVFLYVIIGLTNWYTGLIIAVSVVVATWITKKAAARLVPLQATQEGFEAKFRSELNWLNFVIIRDQFLKINSKLKLLSFVQSGVQQLFVLLPFVVLMPLYISKAITVGAFFQSVNALGKIVQSLLVIIDNRQLIVQIESCLLRLKFLTTQDEKEV